MPTNRELLMRAAGTAISTGSLTGGGLLQPYQARQFIQQTFEATNLAPLVRHEMRVERRGEIDKIGIAPRLLREKKENTDDGYRASVATSQISFSTTPVRLPWEVTEETLRQNIEGENMNKVITDLMTAQLGVDLEDLYLNSDENAGKAKTFSQSDTYSAGDIVTYNKKLYKFDIAHSAGAWTGTDATLIGEDGDADFLKVNDGWIKQIKEGGHILDKSTEDEMSLDMFYQMVASIPNKYNNGKLRWLMSPRRAQQWELFLLNLVAHHGGAVPDNMYTAPVKIATVECPSMSDDVILLTDPKNLIVVNSYTVKIRSTNTDKESIMMDKRFYVAHLDYDPIIEEKDATGILLLKR